MKTGNSERLYARATTFMPGGVNSPVRACRNVGRTPLFIKRAAGSRIYDADGNEFIDLVCSWGPDIFGHADPDILRAVTEACASGLTFGACHEGEIVLAERIRKHFPSMELLRLVSSGTEAAMSAVRAARGFTGRDRILKFEGCYHGHSDGLLAKAGSGLLTAAIPGSAGVPAGYTENTLLAGYNDEGSVRAVFEHYGKEIAAVIVEPVAANMGVVPPEEGFLSFLRKITEDNGALLIFDEVITEVLDISPRKFDHPLQHLEFLVAMGNVDLKHVKGRSDVEEQLEKYHFEKRIVLFLLKNLSFSHEHGFRWKPYLKSIYTNIEEISKGLEDKGVYEGPTLFIRGGKSDYIVDKDVEQIERQFTDYQLVTLSESGHWIHVDDPKGFMEATEKFLLRV